MIYWYKHHIEDLDTFKIKIKYKSFEKKNNPDKSYLNLTNFTV